MSGRRSTRGRRSAAPNQSARRGGGIRRASAGFNRTALARPARDHPGRPGAVWRERAARPSATAGSTSSAPACTPETTVRQRLGVHRRPNLFRLSTDGMADRPARAADRGRRVDRDRPARHAPRPDRRAQADPRLAGRRAALPRRRRPGRSSRPPTASATCRSSPTSGPCDVPDLGARDQRRGRGSARSDRRPRPGRLRRRDPARLAPPGRRRERRGRDSTSRSTTTTGSPSTAGRTAGGATFGFYTPTIRRTDLIPGQVRLLRSLLAGQRGGHRHDHPGRRPARRVRR